MSKDKQEIIVTLFFLQSKHVSWLLHQCPILRTTDESKEVELAQGEASSRREKSLVLRERERRSKKEKKKI